MTVAVRIEADWVRCETHVQRVIIELFVKTMPGGTCGKKLFYAVLPGTGILPLGRVVLMGWIDVTITVGVTASS